MPAGNLLLIILSSTQSNQCSLFSTLFVLNSRWSSTSWLTDWIGRWITVWLTGWLAGRRSKGILIPFIWGFEMRKIKKTCPWCCQKEEAKADQCPPSKKKNYNITFFVQYSVPQIILKILSISTQLCAYFTVINTIMRTTAILRDFVSYLIWGDDQLITLVAGLVEKKTKQKTD